MQQIQRHLNFLIYSLKHKYYVFIYGRKLGVSIVQLLMHDYTKFFPDEWFAGVDFQAGGKGSQNVVDKHHKRNRHHPQYWVKDGETQPMPERYCLEVIADWYAMDKLKNETSYEWYYHSPRNTSLG